MCQRVVIVAPRWLTCLAWFALSLGCRPMVAAETWESDAARLRQVIDYVRAKTTAPTTGKIILNDYNGWYYQTLMVLEGAQRVAGVIPEPRFQNYAPDRLAFFVDQIGSGNGRGQGPLRFYFGWKELWCTGLAHVWFAQALAAKGQARQVYQEYIDRFTAFVNQVPRVDQGLLANVGTQVRTDDVYLMVPAMLRLATIEGNAERTADALSQLIGFHRRLFQVQDALYRHIWDAKNGTYADAYWGRGNGWMALAHVDVLAYLPVDHPRRAEVLANYRAQMAGLRRYQAEDGGWHQVIDHPESWSETSCTGMFTYAMARGVNEGWLDPSYAVIARKGWNLLKTKVMPSGSTIDTCPATGPGKLEHYLNRPRATDDPHSFGPILLAGAEILRLNRVAP
jgi:unsaturated rhamnogalacturonyl hydrolase